MNQLRRFKQTLFVASALGGALALTSCEDATNAITIQLNLDRPVDVAFTCYGGMRVTKPNVAGVGTAGDEIVSSPQQLASCDLRSQDRAADTAAALPKGQEDLTSNGGAAIPAVNYYGLIVQSGPGTVALAQFPVSPRTAYGSNEVVVLDADPLTPGKNSISVGSTPVAIATDPSGCYGITANAGSCDLSTLDISSALKFDGQAKVDRVAVTNKSGVAVNARPAAMVSSPGISFPQALMPATDAERVGQTCPAQPTGYLYVAYPSCHVVAVINAGTGRIEQGIQFAADGTASIVDGAAVTCTDECSGQVVSTAGPEPVTLDLMNDVVRVVEEASKTPDMRPVSRRLAIGARNSNRVTIVDLDANYLPVAAAPLQVVLEQTADADLGVLDVALTQTIGMGQNNVIDADHPRNAIQETTSYSQFAYAVTTDGTIRVASLLGAARECDTRIDSRKLTMADYTLANLSCLPLDVTKRRLGSVGPGIPEPLDGVFSAVSTFRIQATIADERAPGPSRLVGYFGVATSTSGATYIIETDDDDKKDFPTSTLDKDALDVDVSTTLPHQLRDQVSKRNALAQATDATTGATTDLCNSGGAGIDESGNASGGARLSGNFNRLNQVEVIAKTKELTLPGIRQLSCIGSDTNGAAVAVPEPSFAAPPKVRKETFPDTQSLRAFEDWRVVWEGTLSGDNLGQAIDGLAVRRGPVAVTGMESMTVSDKSRPYCAAGVEPFDTVQLRGCDPASTLNVCPVGTRCYLHPDNRTGQGLCLPENSINSLSELCRDFLVAARRYNVGEEVLAGQLTLHPRMRVLRSTPLEGCTDDNECKILADYEQQQTLEGQPKDVAATVNPRSFTCKPDKFRRNKDEKLCVMTCQRDADCDVASACVAGTCMEGPIPDGQCIAGMQRYDLRASDAFVVIGTTTAGVSNGYQHSIVAQAGTGKCEKSPTANPLQVGRIPLELPVCNPADPSINPCREDTMHMAARSTFDADCNATTTTSEQLTPSILFRNAGMSLHFVNPTYKGDKRCIGDGLGITGIDAGKTIPSVFTGFAFTFRQTGGYSPLGIRTNAVIPVRVVRGPQQSIWVVDEGDYLTETSALPSTRGKVFRIESSLLSTVNTLQ